MFIVQRARFNKDFRKATTYEELVDFDYMGAAEYEFGALPFSNARINDNADEYELFIIDELKSSTGVPLNLYCRRDEKDKIVEDLMTFVKRNDPNQVSTYHLKARINFAHMYYGFVWSIAPETDNFWWDLRGDYIFFYGAADRKNAFLQVVANAIKEHKEFKENDPEEYEHVMDGARRRKNMN